MTKITGKELKVKIGIFTKQDEIAMSIRDVLSELDDLAESVAYLRRQVERLAEYTEVTLDDKN